MLNAMTQLPLWEQRTKKLEANMNEAVSNIWNSLESSEGREDYTWKPGSRPSMYSFPGEAKASTEARSHSAAPATTSYSTSPNLHESGRPTGSNLPGVGAYAANMVTIPSNQQPFKLLTGAHVLPPGIERSHIPGPGSAPITSQPSSDRKNKFSEKVAKVTKPNKTCIEERRAAST